VAVPLLHEFLRGSCHFDFELVIADNGSTDGTLLVARSFVQQFSQVRVTHLELSGRGRALKQVWSQSTADILSYMDVDLSADLNAFPRLIEVLAGGQFDLATGSRLRSGSITARCWRRETSSRCYNWLIRNLLSTQFSDAQCGFKAITREAAACLLPAIEDTGWFFDTELLTVAQNCGYRIFDMPIHWTEDRDSRVRILPTAWADIKGLLRVRRNLRRGRYAHVV
jgi:glycosyltransferase involved in cell wall biosynthesis